MPKAQLLEVAYNVALERTSVSGCFNITFVGRVYNR